MEKLLLKQSNYLLFIDWKVLTISGLPQQLYAENASLPLLEGYSDCISKPGSAEIALHDLC